MTAHNYQSPSQPTPSDESDSALRIEDVVAMVAAAITRRHGKVEEITPDSELLLTGLLDSLTLVNIVADLEQKLGRKLPEDLVVARNFRTPTTLHTVVSGLLTESVR